MPFSTQAATTTTAFQVDAYVERYTSGKARYTLVPVTGDIIRNAQGDYMRLLPPADAMRDIDTAPLNSDGAADDMTAAAMAWLTQQQTTANRRPELPPQS